MGFYNTIESPEEQSQVHYAREDPEILWMLARSATAAVPALALLHFFILNFTLSSNAIQNAHCALRPYGPVRSTRL